MIQNESTGGHPLVAKWRRWMLAQSLSKRTVIERASTVDRFATWSGIEPQHADADHIAEWLAEGGDGEWSERTRQTYHSALVAWFKWLNLQGYRESNPMVHVGKPKRIYSVPHPVSNEELIRLLSTRMNRRTRAMILLAAFAGLRTHEIAKIRGEHLDLIARKMRVKGKGGHVDALPVHHRIVEIAYQAMPREGWWFPGTEGGHQRRESVGGTIKEVMQRAGVVGSAHSLRHWYGTALVEAGNDLRTVQELMRHRQLNSTQIYTLVADKRRLAGIDSLDPFALLRAERAGA